ncbi:MAG: sensor histidine kinase, partial [Bacteroidia bacterium]
MNYSKTKKMLLNDSVFVMLILILLFVSWFSYERITGLIDVTDLINTNNMVKLKLEESLSDISEEEAGQRGFLLTKDSAFLKPVTSTYEKIQTELSQISYQIANHPRQQENIKVLKKLVEKRYDRLLFILYRSSYKNITDSYLIEGESIMKQIHLKVNEMMELENTYLQKRIKERNVYASFTPIISLVLLVSALFIIIVYVMQIRKDKEKLILLNEKLNKRDAELTLKNAELEHANSDLRSFSYISSHDLQEPLRTISNFVNLFQSQYKGKLDKNSDEYLGYICSATAHMQALIKDLLDYSRIGSEKNIAEVDCNVMIENVLKETATLIKNTNTEINFKQLPTVKGFYNELKSLFVHLINNAIKYKKKDTPLIIDITAEDRG